MQVFAQEVEINGTTIDGPLKGIESVGDLISIVLSFLFPFAGVLLLLMLIWGGYSYMTSLGEPEKIESARARITTAIIGFILLVLSFFLARAIAYVFGLDGSLLF